MKESKIFSRQNLTEKFHYVYRVTIDGKYYIGKRSGFLNDLATGVYKTSSKLIWEKLKNGSHFSKIKIIQVLPSSKDALEFEKRILLRVNAKANLKFLNQQNGSGDFTCKQHTEKSKEKISEKSKERYDINTEEGRKQREIHSEIQRNSWDENTELGRKRREEQSNKRKEYFNPETEQGRQNRENASESQRNRWDENTELGQQRREEMSEIITKKFDPNTEEGRKRRENHSEKIKEKAKEQLQKRINDSILGELMFDEAFIRQNLLILDDKNNLRFLWSVYSKLTGFSRSFIKEHKREGKLSFLSGIKAIKLSEEYENSKIEAIIKSRNDEKELSLKAS